MVRSYLKHFSSCYIQQPPSLGVLRSLRRLKRLGWQTTCEPLPSFNTLEDKSALDKKNKSEVLLESLHAQSLASGEEGGNLKLIFFPTIQKSDKYHGYVVVETDN